MSANQLSVWWLVNLSKDIFQESSPYLGLWTGQQLTTDIFPGKVPHIETSWNEETRLLYNLSELPN